VQRRPAAAARAVSWEVIFQLVAILAPLSLVAVGGAFSVIPEIHRQTVDVQGWLTSTEFTELYALAQLSPGPNILVVSLVGWKVAGPLGGLVALLAMTVPSSLLAFSVIHAWQKLGGASLLMTIRTGLAPVAIGLVLASGLILVSAANHTVPAYLVTATAIVLTLKTNVHPLLMMAVGGGLAVAGWL
jgi:chromate transporter